MRNKIRSVSMLIGIFGLLEVSGWAQCVMCGTALASSPEGQAIARSFRYGIGILLIAPYLILGAIGYAVFRAYKKRIEARLAETKFHSREGSEYWLKEPAVVVRPHEISPN